MRYIRLTSVILSATILDHISYSPNPTRLLEILGSRGARSIRLASLLDKPEPRINKELKIDYTGFVIPNKFVVGFGLDVAGRYRNLPFIGVVKDPDKA